jgi:ubiquinone/menaquinone biosynthesis C-methylase UbiE
MCRAICLASELQDPVGLERLKRRTASVYNRWSRVWDLARFTNGNIYEAVLASFDAQHQRVLDAGCGTGIMSARLAATGRETVGLDLSPAMIKRARRKMARNLNFVIGDAEKLPMADSEFDAVVNLISLHHYPHPERALSEFHRVLRPDGRLVVVIFDRNSRYIRLVQGVNRWTKPIAGITWQKTVAEALKLVEEAGFTRVQASLVPYWIKTWLIVAERDQIRPCVP